MVNFTYTDPNIKKLVEKIGVEMLEIDRLHSIDYANDKLREASYNRYKIIKELMKIDDMVGTMGSTDD